MMRREDQRHSRLSDMRRRKAGREPDWWGQLFDTLDNMRSIVEEIVEIDAQERVRRVAGRIDPPPVSEPEPAPSMPVLDLRAVLRRDRPETRTGPPPDQNEKRRPTGKGGSALSKDPEASTYALSPAGASALFCAPIKRGAS